MSTKFMSAQTPREQLRTMLRAGMSMNAVDNWNRQGIVKPSAYDRFVRIFAWATATEHPLTRGVPLAKWSARRERLRVIVQGMRQ